MSDVHAAESSNGRGAYELADIFRLDNRNLKTALRDGAIWTIGTLLDAHRPIGFSTINLNSEQGNRRQIMSNAFVKIARRVAIAALFTATLAACSTPGEQTASLDGTSHIRSWADWSAAPVLQTAALPQANSWVDTAQIAPGGMVPGNLVSNSGAGN